jgi:rRNA biogenesis protein RRP5
MFQWFRALQTINYREESEEFNVWIAYLNLENVYGKPPKVLCSVPVPTDHNMSLRLTYIYLMTL